MRLTLTNFRSYACAELQTDGRPVVLAGANGAGKTNILDAISLLSPGRGLRGAKLGEHVRRGPSAPSEALWAVAASVMRDCETYEIGTGLAIGPGGGERRLVRLNGAPAQSSADLADILSILWLTPAMDRLFIEGANGRRKFLDRLVLGFDARHASNSTRYEAATRERARLLKYGPRDPGWLSGLEQQMAETGVAIAQARAGSVEKLNATLAERAEAGEFPAAQLALRGDMEALIADAAADSVSAMRLMLEKLRARDAESGRTLFGPHVSDLSVRHTAKRADARECSTGEQKALLISIALAHAWTLARGRNGMAPILLLDEIAAHLDGVRRAALFEEIIALGAQAWMTGTDHSLFEGLEGRADILCVSNGALERATV
ncbi:MAG: DNA replication/repair protein RecF [Alphaproteobacteria bacterium]|nr:DNA replication/repair protein RecF [Alphaproteobacteria bacterium]